MVMSCVSICKVVIYQPKYTIPQNYPKTRKNSHTHNPPTILWNTYKFIITPAICKSRCLTILFESVRICYIREVYRLRALFVYMIRKLRLNNMDVNDVTVKPPYMMKIFGE